MRRAIWTRIPSGPPRLHPAPRPTTRHGPLPSPDWSVLPPKPSARVSIPCLPALAKSSRCNCSSSSSNKRAIAWATARTLPATPSAPAAQHPAGTAAASPAPRPPCCLRPRQPPPPTTCCSGMMPATAPWTCLSRRPIRTTAILTTWWTPLPTESISWKSRPPCPTRVIVLAPAAACCSTTAAAAVASCCHPNHLTRMLWKRRKPFLAIWACLMARLPTSSVDVVLPPSLHPSWTSLIPYISLQAVLSVLLCVVMTSAIFVRPAVLLRVTRVQLHRRTWGLIW